MHSLRATTTTTLALLLLLRSASAAPPTPIIDQEPASDQFPVFLRADFFAPVGQSFVPQFRRHIGVNLFLRNLLLFGDQPPAIFTVTLRTDSVTGPILASGSTPPLPLFQPQWLEILFDEPVSLVRGDSYFLAVSTANVSGFWGRAGFNPYPAGVGFERGAPHTPLRLGFPDVGPPG
jgi:hypothetical protein